MNFGKRLVSVRTSMGLTQAEVARRLGWNPSNYARLERGRVTPSLRSLEAIAGILEVPLSALTSDDSLPVEIPVLAFVSAGEGVAFTDQGYPAGGGMYYIDRPPSFTDPHGFGVEVSGDSMVPKYQEGQVVLVDTRKRPVNGDFAVVGLDTGEKYVKRFRETGGRVILESVNPLYPPVVVEPSRLRFAYKIVWSKER